MESHVEGHVYIDWSVTENLYLKLELVNVRKKSELSIVKKVIQMICVSMHKY